MGKTYRIGEAAKLLNLKSYVLRFWETEFTQLQPLRTDTGQRLYSERDIEVLKTIRHLLHERGLTIDGARKALQEENISPMSGSGEFISPEPAPVSAPVSAPVVQEVISELEALRKLLLNKHS